MQVRAAIVKRALLVLLALVVGVGLAMASIQMERAVRAPKATATIEAVWVPTATARPPPEPTGVGPFDVRRVALGQDSTVTDGTYVIELAGRTLWKVGTGNYSSSVSFTSYVGWLPDGRLLRVVAKSKRPWDENTGIDVIDPTTGHTQRIFSGATGLVRLSADGRWVALTRPRPDASIQAVGTLHLVSVDGTNPRQLTAMEVRNVQWSPRGDYIGFQAEESGNPHLLWLSTGAITEVSSLGLQRPISFAWSPDGGTLAVAGANGLYLYTVDTGQTRELPSARTERSVGLAWSPDGSTLLRADRASNHVRPYVIDVASAQERALPAAFDAPIWSPDSAQVAYQADACNTGIWDIFVTRADGGAARRLTTPETVPSGVLGIVWSPVSPVIAFSARETVMLVDVYSGKVSPIARSHDGTRLAPYGWSPDGRYLAFGFAPIGRGLCD